MKIPNRFTILGKTFAIVVDDTLSRDGKLGLLQFDKGLISLQRTDVNVRVCDQQAFCHELVHAILFSMCENDLAANERFVDLFAGMLHQAIETQQ